MKNTCIMRSKTVHEHREVLTRLAEARPVLPNVKIEASSLGGVPCEWIYRAAADSTKVIMYIHGGSWMLGGLKTAQPVGALLAESINCRVIAIGYRLSPEHPFPAGLDDCGMAFDSLLELGYSEDDIALFGDSAGGNLCLALTTRLKSEGRRLPLALGLASPVTDMTFSSEIIKSRDDLIYTWHNGRETDIFSLYAADSGRDNPLLSPLYGDLAGFPPTLIHVGGGEPLSLDCVAFAKKAYEQGVDIQLRVYREMFHDFTIVGLTLKESRDSIKEFAGFFEKQFE